MNKKYIVSLNKEERGKLQETLSSNATSKTIRKRAGILLLSDVGAGVPARQQEIADRCGASIVTVFNTVRDYCGHGIDYVLSYKRTNAPNPPIVSGETQARIVALACSQPPEGFSRWTVRLLTERVVELEILEDVSRETVRQTLKKQGLSLI
jgi:transposase